eukprot:11584410-Alexandrium_andersonii.AAC.1
MVVSGSGLQGVGELAMEGVRATARDGAERLLRCPLQHPAIEEAGEAGETNPDAGGLHRQGTVAGLSVAFGDPDHGSPKATESPA